MTAILRTAAVAAGLAGAGLIATSDAAPAEEYSSRFTSTATRSCKELGAGPRVGEGDWGVLSCPGLGGFVVRVAEDDLRMTVSVGLTIAAAGEEPAAQKSFGPFNLANERLEWRGVNGVDRPFAIIQRWLISDNEKLDKSARPISIPLLVVTRLAPGPVCHVAYVDARTNFDAIRLARQAADQHARSFNCANKPMVIGERGRAIELALPKDDD
jgi:hypothetical protein